jgi:hypothetical protein
VNPAPIDFVSFVVETIGNEGQRTTDAEYVRRIRKACTAVRTVLAACAEDEIPCTGRDKAIDVKATHDGGAAGRVDLTCRARDMVHEIFVSAKTPEGTEWQLNLKGCRSILGLLVEGSTQSKSDTLRLVELFEITMDVSEASARGDDGAMRQDLFDEIAVGHSIGKEDSNGEVHYVLPSPLVMDPTADLPAAVHIIVNDLGEKPAEMGIAIMHPYEMFITPDEADPVATLRSIEAHRRWLEDRTPPDPATA